MHKSLSTALAVIAAVALGIGIRAAARSEAVVQAKSDQYRVYGFGARSCGQWTVARKTGGEVSQINEGWVTGFVSGAGYTGTPMARTDSDAIMGWLDSYCADHPLDTVSDGSQALVIELRRRWRG